MYKKIGDEWFTFFFEGGGGGGVGPPPGIFLKILYMQYIIGNLELGDYL